MRVFQTDCHCQSLFFSQESFLNAVFLALLLWVWFLQVSLLSKTWLVNFMLASRLQVSSNSSLWIILKILWPEKSRIKACTHVPTKSHHTGNCQMKVEVDWTHPQKSPTSLSLQARDWNPQKREKSPATKDGLETYNEGRNEDSGYSIRCSHRIGCAGELLLRPCAPLEVQRHKSSLLSKVIPRYTCFLNKHLFHSASSFLSVDHWKGFRQCSSFC